MREKDRLYTTTEAMANKMNEYISVFGIVSVIFLIITGLWEIRLWMSFGIICLVLYVVSNASRIVQSYFWTRAMQYGEGYMVTIVKTGFDLEHYGYRIVVEGSIAGRVQKITFGKLAEDPILYLPSNNRCMVYHYKDKDYLQFFYKHDRGNSIVRDSLTEQQLYYQRLVAGFYEMDIEKQLKHPFNTLQDTSIKEIFDVSMERLEFGWAKSKTFATISPIIVKENNTYKMMVVDLYIESKNYHSGNELELGGKLETLMEIQSVSKTYTDEMLKEDAEKYIRQAVRMKWKNVKIIRIDMIIVRGTDKIHS